MPSTPMSVCQMGSLINGIPEGLPISAYVWWGELFLKQEIIIIEDMEEIKDTLPG